MNLDLENFDDGRPKRKRAKKTRDLGRLHALLTRGLPDWVDEDGSLGVYALADRLGISYQALYAQMNRERIGPKRIKTLVELSEISEKGGEGFAPLTYEDFAEFFD